MPEEAAAVEAQSVQEPSSVVSGNVYDHRLGESDNGQRQQKADSESNGQKPAQPQGEKPKELSRYERTKRERAAFRAEREAFTREREAFQREREQAHKSAEEAKRPKRDYTLADLQKYRGQWEREGNFELVEAADKEIAAIKAEQEALKKASVQSVELPVAGTPEHRAQWEAAERELFAADPEFMRSGTRLDGVLRRIMGSEDGAIYRQHPRGIIAAYHRAKMECLEADLRVSQTELQKYKDELKRYQGLTGLSSGAPAQLGTGARVESLRDFERLSTKDMRKHLLSNADKHGVPWF
jgi:hypothetical protein